MDGGTLGLHCKLEVVGGARVIERACTWSSCAIKHGAFAVLFLPYLFLVTLHAPVITASPSES